MATFSILSTDAAGDTSLTYIDGVAAMLASVRNFRGLNDYADNAGNPATITVTRVGYGAGVREMFWSAANGFSRREPLAA